MTEPPAVTRRRIRSALGERDAHRPFGGHELSARACRGGWSRSTCRSSIIVVVLLFPFYWMALTAIKPDEQLIDMEKFNPFWRSRRRFKHIHKLLFETAYPRWLWNTMYVSVAATVLSLFASVLAAYAIVRIRYRGAQWVGGAIFLAYLVPPSILFIPLADDHLPAMGCSTRRWR